MPKGNKHAVLNKPNTILNLPHDTPKVKAHHNFLILLEPLIEGSNQLWGLFKSKKTDPFIPLFDQHKDVYHKTEEAIKALLPYVTEIITDNPLNSNILLPEFKSSLIYFARVAVYYYYLGDMQKAIDTQNKTINWQNRLNSFFTIQQLQDAGMQLTDEKISNNTSCYAELFNFRKVVNQILENALHKYQELCPMIAPHQEIKPYQAKAKLLPIANNAIEMEDHFLDIAHLSIKGLSLLHARDLSQLQNTYKRMSEVYAGIHVISPDDDFKKLQEQFSMIMGNMHAAIQALSLQATNTAPDARTTFYTLAAQAIINDVQQCLKKNAMPLDQFLNEKVNAALQDKEAPGSDQNEGGNNNAQLENRKLLHQRLTREYCAISSECVSKGHGILGESKNKYAISKAMVHLLGKEDVELTLLHFQQTQEYLLSLLCDKNILEAPPLILLERFEVIRPIFVEYQDLYNQLAMTFLTVQNSKNYWGVEKLSSDTISRMIQHLYDILSRNNLINIGMAHIYYNLGAIELGSNAKTRANKGIETLTEKLKANSILKLSIEFSRTREKNEIEQMESRFSEILDKTNSMSDLENNRSYIKNIIPHIATLIEQYPNNTISAQAAHSNMSGEFFNTTQRSVTQIIDKAMLPCIKEMIKGLEHNNVEMVRSALKVLKSMLDFLTSLPSLDRIQTTHCVEGSSSNAPLAMMSPLQVDHIRTEIEGHLIRIYDQANDFVARVTAEKNKQKEYAEVVYDEAFLNSFKRMNASDSFQQIIETVKQKSLMDKTSSVPSNEKQTADLSEATDSDNDSLDADVDVQSLAPSINSDYPEKEFHKNNPFFNAVKERTKQKQPPQSSKAKQQSKTYFHAASVPGSGYINRGNISADRMRVIQKKMDELSRMQDLLRLKHSSHSNNNTTEGRSANNKKNNNPKGGTAIINSSALAVSSRITFPTPPSVLIFSAPVQIRDSFLVNMPKTEMTVDEKTLSEKYKADLSFSLSIIYERFMSNQTLTEELQNALRFNIYRLSDIIQNKIMNFDYYLNIISLLFMPPNGLMTYTALTDLACMSKLFPEWKKHHQLSIEMARSYHLHNFYVTTLMHPAPFKSTDYKLWILSLFLIPMTLHSSSDKVANDFATGFSLDMNYLQNQSFVSELGSLLEEQRENLESYKISYAQKVKSMR